MASTSAQPYVQATFPKSHSDTIECLEFIEGDRRIVTGSRDGSLQVWDAVTGHVMGDPWIDTGSGAVHAIAVSRNHVKVLTGSQDGRIRVWEAATGQMIAKWKPGHTATISSICWSPNELHVASGSEDGTVIIWDAGRGEMVGEPIRTGHRHVYAVRYSSDATLVTSGCNNLVIFWDVKKREALRILEACPASQQVHCITLSSDSRRLFLGCSDRMVQTGTSSQEIDVIRLGGPTGPISAVVLSHDDSLLATASFDPTRHALCLWDLQTNKPIAQLLEHVKGLRCAAFARNGRLLATGGVDKTVDIWNIQALRDRDPNDSAPNTVSDSDVTAGLTGRQISDPLSSDATDRSARRTLRRHPDVADVRHRLPEGFFDDARDRSRSLRHAPQDERRTQPTPFLQVAAARARQVFKVRRPQRSAIRTGSYDVELETLYRPRSPPSQYVLSVTSAPTVIAAQATDETSNHTPRRRTVKENLWLRLSLRLGCLSDDMES